jgi:hypothetical protein
MAIITKRELFELNNVPADQSAKGVPPQPFGHNFPFDVPGGLFDDTLPGILKAIKLNTYIEIALKSITQGFAGRVVNIPALVPTRIIERAEFPRGYILINPAETIGFSPDVQFFGAANAPAVFVPGSYTSAAFNVAVIDTIRMFLVITASAGTLTIDAQSQDPITGAWVTTSSNIFTGASAIGSYYLDFGAAGVDENFRLVATVAVGNVTFSLGAVLKCICLTPQIATVYVGNQDLNLNTGYPILPAQREYLWLWNNVELWGFAQQPSTLKIFQLQ